jgi:uncharacterized phage protein gp47/JayE
MSFQRDTLPTIIDRIRTNLVTRLSIVSTVLRRALVRILPVVFGSEVNDLHGHLDYNAKQIFASTADEDNLVLHGVELDEARKPATFAGGPVDIAGAPDGTVLAAGSKLQRQDGFEYLTDADAVIAAGVATVSVTAAVEGADGNADEDTALTLADAVAGIQANASVSAGGITGGVDLEDLELYRARVLQRKRQPPASGTVNDYERWALEVPGVTRAWIVKEGAGPGTVQVYIMADDAGDGPFADGALIAAVQAHLDDPVRHIVGSHVYVVTPLANAMNVTLHIVPDNTNTRAAVLAELADLVFRNQDANGSTIPLAEIEATVEDSTGITDSAVTVPAAAFVSAVGHIPTLGVPTWA